MFFLYFLRIHFQCSIQTIKHQKSVQCPLTAPGVPWFFACVFCILLIFLKTSSYFIFSFFLLNILGHFLAYLVSFLCCPIISIPVLYYFKSTVWIGLQSKKILCCWKGSFVQFIYLFISCFLELKAKLFRYYALLSFLFLSLESYHIVTCNCNLVLQKYHSKEARKNFAELSMFRFQEI